MEARRPRLAEIGLFLLVVALPLVFTPFSASPFGDGKLVVLVAACLALVASGLAADRRIAMAGGALVVATLLAALVGVDPLEGLTARTTSSGGGLITVACVVVLAALGAAMPASLRERAIRWSIGTGVAVAAIGLATRFAPAVFEELFPGGGLSGSTLGNPVFAIAFVAAALGALLSTEPPPERRWFWFTLVVMTLGLASFGQRASIVSAIAAGLIALWRLPSSRRRVTRALAVIVALLVVWQLVDPLLPLPGNLRPQLATLSSERARLAMWEVGLRSAVERPALGWGPGSTRSAHIAEATASELEVSGRGVGDAHNLFVTALVETGVIGLVLLAVLVAMLLARAWPRSRSAERAPAFAAAILLGVTSMIEPVNLVVTPLLFLFLAVAGPVSGHVVAARLPPVGRRVGRAAVALALGVSLVVSVQMLAAASLERWGRVYGEPWALQAALRVQPWRLTSTERLALIWALDGRAGDEAAGERARDLMAGAVDEHPWDPDVRPWAADVETLLDDEAAARAWIEEHLDRFPGDERAVREAGSTGAGGLENPLAGA